jgi:serine/threonine protein kinase/WD40 repeat protein
MSTSSADRNPVERLAEELAERLRQGETPSLAEYVEKYPQHADEIRELFPALVMIERFKPAPQDHTGAYGGPGPDGGQPLQRLGDYHILREVGRGGMGVVYEAEQESLGRHVALKVLPQQALHDARHLHRFKREARAAARLHHTNIVPVHGVGEQGGLHYYVMQFIHGQGLDQVLAELRRLRQSRQAPAGPATGGGAAEAVAQSLLSGQFVPTSPTGLEVSPGPLPPDEAGSGSRSDVPLPSPAEGAAISESGWPYWHSVARIGIQVAEALAYASSQGILHRDIKPSNLLLDTQGTVWVTDFGLAKAATEGDNLTHTGDIVGTLRYLAPERFDGKADIRSDLYALGLTLYELLTLRSAFDATDRNKLIAQVMHDAPPRPRTIDPGVPRDLETIVLKATAREPERRYQTPAELTDDLGRFLDDRPIRARRSGALQRGWRWCRRNPAKAVLSSAVVALVLTIAVGSSVALLRLQFEQGQTMMQLERAEGAEKESRNAEKDALQAKKDARKAEKDALDRLRGSRLAEAQVRHWSGKPGRHFKSLEALQEAAAIRSSLELRNEAIACMPLVDLRVARKWRRNEPWFNDALETFGTRLERYARTGLHARFVRSVPVTFDARLERYAVAEADPEGKIRVCRVRDQVEVARFPGYAYRLSLSSDGRYLLGQAGGAVCVWDLGRSQCIFRLPASSGVQLLTPDARRLVIDLGDGLIGVYDLASGKQLKRLTLFGPKEGWVSAMALHPDGRNLAVAAQHNIGQHTIHVLDLETGKVPHRLEHTDRIADLAWHPDGALLAAACADRKVHVWNVPANKPHAILAGHQDAVRRCAFNHGGDLLASSADDGTTRLWDVIGGKELVIVPGSFIQFSGDDRFLAYAKPTEVGIWEVATGRECRTLHAPAQKLPGPFTVSFQPRGRLLASTNTDGVRFWDVTTGKELGLLPARGVYSSQSSGDFDPSGGSFLACDTLGARRWPIQARLASGKVRIGPPQAIHDTSRYYPPPSFTQGALSKDGRWIATASRFSSMIEVIGVEKPTETVSRCDTRGTVWSVALSPDGGLLVTGTERGPGLKVWDARAGQLVRELPAGSRAAACFSPDGKCLATTSNGEGTHLWDVTTWKVLHHLSKERSSGPAFASDGSLLALSYQIGTVVLIDPVKGREIASLLAPNPLPTAGMCFNDDGSQLAVACCNHHTIQLWDLRAIRARLKAMKLDWDLAAYPPARGLAGQRPLRAEVVLE